MRLYSCSAADLWSDFPVSFAAMPTLQDSSRSSLQRYIYVMFTYSSHAHTDAFIQDILSIQSCRYPLDPPAMEEGSSLAGHLRKMDPTRLMRLVPLSLV